MKRKTFNPNLGMNMPTFLAKNKVYLTHEDREKMWKEIIASKKK